MVVGGLYKVIDLMSMRAYDREVSWELRAEPFTGMVWRCYIKQEKTYVGYGADLNQRIEEQYQLYSAHQGPEGIKLFLNKSSYFINFSEMAQINMTTNYARKVTRTEY